jgi:hypothetical protein
VIALSVQRLRYVLFRARVPQPLAAVTRALAKIPGVATTSMDGGGWTVKDSATGHAIEVTLADGPLIAADIRAIAANHWRDDPEGRAEIAATDARFELRYPDDDAAVNPMLLVQDAIERATGGVGYDLRFDRLVVAAEGESLVVDEGPEQNAENERLLREVEAMSTEELDRDLAAAGIDPEVSRREGAEFIATLFEQRALSAAIEAALGGAGHVAREPRATLLERLAAARDVPAVGGAIGWLLRSRPLTSMSDGELQTVTDEITQWMARGKA